MKFTLYKDKETKGTFRFMENDPSDDRRPLSVYLEKDTVKDLGNPDTIEISIEAKK